MLRSNKLDINAEQMEGKNDEAKADLETKHTNVCNAALRTP